MLCCLLVFLPLRYKHFRPRLLRRIVGFDPCPAGVKHASDRQQASLPGFARLQRASPLGQHVRVHDVARYSRKSVL